jgi:hypothetical protein
MFYGILGIVLTLSNGILVSCSKEKDEPASQMSHSYNYPNAAGILVVTKSFTYDINGGYLNAIEASSASAFFPASGESTSGLDGGSVKIKGNELTKDATNHYLFMDLANQLNLYGNMTLQWEIAGKGDVPAFSFTTNKGIPSFNGLAELPLAISKGSGAIVDFYGKVAYADSVLVMISGDNRSVYKVFPASGPNGQFTSSELSGLSNTQAATIMVVPYNVLTAWANNKQFYFINETAYYKVNIEITN